jgi:hypothetical protein
VLISVVLVGVVLISVVLVGGVLAHSVLIGGVLVHSVLIGGVPASGQRYANERPALFCPSPILSCPYDNRA